MKQINIHEAKTNLSKLLERVESGEQIIIANRGVPKAILSKYIPQDNSIPDSPLGRYAGQIEISDDFNDEDEEINQLFGV
ncbi:MAG: type II toxin-antitoxin system prevent-host-death family antitoxin [Xenococcus sp. MO_188.B8]|nr:type II toxin-antitoxin system prevent-host-death family antitoxin [Xenococcus sp. MO_188.B8]